MVRMFRLALIGPTGVGKTSIVRRWKHGVFDPNWVESTIGAAVVAKGLVEVWDTAGQDRYAAILPVYTRSADAVAVVIDASGPALGITRFLQTIAPRQSVFVVVNKCDRAADEQRATEMGQSIARQAADLLSIPHPPVFTVSAKSGKGVELFFRHATSTPRQTRDADGQNDHRDEERNGDGVRRHCGPCAIA